jgi:hypothetical protein
MKGSRIHTERADAVSALVLIVMARLFLRWNESRGMQAASDELRRLAQTATSCSRRPRRERIADSSYASQFRRECPVECAGTRT